MELKQQRSKEELKSQQPRKNLFIGSLIATFIAITPYIFYLYESVPDTKIWDTFLFAYNSGYFESANTAMYFFVSKAVPLLLIFIWFFTCRHWWYHALLVPITMFLYQIFNLFNDDSDIIDEFQLIYMIPVMAVIIPTIYLIRARMFNKINDVNKSLQDLEDEFKVSPKSLWGKIKQYF